MKMSQSSLGIPVLIALLVGVIGCGKTLQSHTNLTDPAIDSQSSAEVDAQIAKAQQASKDADTALTSTQQAIAAISDSKGNINVKLFLSGGGPLSPLLNKLQPVFDDLYAKALAVRDQCVVARAALGNALIMLKASEPEQLEQIQQITEQIAKIEDMEVQFRDSMKTLANRLHVGISALNGIISGATSFIPGFGWLADMAIDHLVMNKVKAQFSGLEAKLLAL